MPSCTSGVCLTILLIVSSHALGADDESPKEVKVLPVFFLPKGETPPTKQQTADLQKHMVWAQSRYKELLQGRDTFVLASKKPHVYHAERDMAYYRAQTEGAAPQIVDELLRRYKCNRYNCPRVFVAVVMNSREDYPSSGARPLNGGVNKGGGIVEMSSYALDRAPNFQSTLQHELGHAFGLSHVDVYGYNMQSNPSIMSYNPSHHTNRFTPSATPGVLIPEDLRGLARNHQVFSRLKFDPKQDVPAGYKMRDAVFLGPMNIPGHPILEPANKPTDSQRSRATRNS
jgi:hypothetical protein